MAKFSLFSGILDKAKSGANYLSSGQLGSDIFDATYKGGDATQTLPYKAVNKIAGGISKTTGMGMEDKTQSLLFKGVQGGANLYTGAKEGLLGIEQNQKQSFDAEMSQKRQQFISDMLAQGRKKEDIFSALDSLQAKGEFDYNPGFGSRLATGLGTRLGEAQRTTERLADTPIVKRMATGIPSYAGDVVGTVFEPVGAALSPVVQKVIEKTGQTENVQEIGQWWEGIRQSNPNFADAIEGSLNVAGLAPLPLVKPVGQAIEKGAKAGGKAIVRGAEVVAPKVIGKVKKAGETVGTKYTQAKIYLAGLDDKTQEAIRNTSAKEMDDILTQANATVGKKGDYVQTPYHVGAEKAQKTLNTIDENLKMRQNERMTALDESPIAKIDLSEARNTARKALDELNVEDIQDGIVIPKKGREAFIDGDNQSDITAFNKLKEILADDVSPTQTMDRIKKLQEWVYENKTRIGFKGVSDKMERVLTRVQGSMNATFKRQLPPEYAQIMDSMSSDIQLKNRIQEVFGIDDAGNPVGNRGEMIMKRLANGTTTSGEARKLALEIKDRYGIDLIKEARLRQMAMDLVGDDRGQTLFGAIARGKSGLIDLVTQKTLGKIVNKEGVVRKLATGKAEVVKKPKPLYKGNTFRKGMAEEARMPKALPAPSGKATGAKNVRVNQPKEKTPLESTKKAIIKDPRKKALDDYLELKSLEESLKKGDEAMNFQARKDLAIKVNAVRKKMEDAQYARAMSEEMKKMMKDAILDIKASFPDGTVSVFNKLNGILKRSKKGYYNDIEGEMGATGLKREFSDATNAYNEMNGTNYSATQFFEYLQGAIGK